MVNITFKIWIFCYFCSLALQMHTYKFIHESFSRQRITLQCVSVVAATQALCNPRDCSMPSFPVHHRLSESCSLSRWCCLTISSSAFLFSFCLQPLPASGSFPVSRLFTSGGPSIGASASVLQ